MPYPNVSGSMVRGNYSGRAHVVSGVRPQSSFMTALLGFSSINEGINLTEGILGMVSMSYTSTERGGYGNLRGIAYQGSMGSIDGGEAPGDRHMQVGVLKNTTDGSPAEPCLQITYPGFWRFRWTVKGGKTKTISVKVKQNSTGSMYRPSIIVRANPLIGVNNDVSASAAEGTDWTTLGPISILPTTTGSVWVELHNNNLVYPSLPGQSTETSFPALFDHIQTT